MRNILLFSFLTALCLTAQVVFAQESGLTYHPVVQIPGLDPGTQNTDQYVNALYLLAITVAALLAVVKIIFGGVKWMLSDIVTDKASAKKDIWGAILGLLIVLGTFIILNTINPNLLRLNFLQNATPLDITLHGKVDPNFKAEDYEAKPGQRSEVLACEEKGKLTDCSSAINKCKSEMGGTETKVGKFQLYCYIPTTSGGI